ncbi:hypothetical protein Noc_1136 [Nitrosococcus oceani ATCC 19707]|uniref:Restriction endonuclease n=2 Tax=Nitrosococcus oceani TaxID=1229 RepID=Q3JC06_NITOC|nr:hypothetical protein [Nitrosococcus oceani]ABA57640.1 hypothetical protein Noc_1136 [Nitrosococcus oceani ATCC 19707]EDZ68030.1 hypothetical protein NOC27_1357 [Nitrosococcus oceani AFC27]KFI19927.1 hypothetical protein IB75_05885 [Nitrosococcus oceani C-27]GEM19281.1 hypothetical protein NONS58_06610 [Nitrosococcus oceani]
MNSELKRLIKIAGTALEAEDRFLREAIAKNRTAYPSEKCGILRNNNERYYQFIIWRALVSSFPFTARIEIQSHDLVLNYPDDASKWFAVIEMKRWMSSTGEVEIPGIIRDINDKLRPSHAKNTLMLIFSAGPSGTINTEFGWLSKRLGISQVEDCSAWENYYFPTVNRVGEDVDFWLAGYQVNRANMASENYET